MLPTAGFLHGPRKGRPPSAPFLRGYGWRIPPWCPRRGGQTAAPPAVHRWQCRLYRYRGGIRTIQNTFAYDKNSFLCPNFINREIFRPNLKTMLNLRLFLLVIVVSLLTRCQSPTATSV